MGALLAQRKSMLVSFICSVLFIFGYTSAMPANSQTYSNCGNTNYVIGCGVSSAADISNHYSEPGVADIFAYFGISKSDVNSMGSGAVLGDVYSNGDVKVQTSMPNGNTGYHLVATNAVTAGRENITGSKKVIFGGTTFYVRPTNVSFQSSPLTAYVMLDNNKQFKFAILKECGNPVKATPTPAPIPPPAPSQTTPPPTPQPKPTPPQPAQTSPPPVQSQTQTQSQSQSQYQAVTVNQAAQTPSSTTNNYYTQPQQQTQTTYTPPPAAAPVYTQPAASTTYKLPNTGPGNVIGLATTFGLCVGLTHYMFFGRRSAGFLSGVKYF